MVYVYHIFFIPSVINGHLGWFLSLGLWGIATMEYYVAIKKKEILSSAGLWMELEAIILSKLTQEEKTKYSMFSVGAEWWELMNTQKGTTDTGVYLRVVGGKRERNRINNYWVLDFVPGW